MQKASALLIVLTLWATGDQSALAQVVSSADEVIEEFVVTGSRIGRRDFSSPSPISTIDRSVLEGSGQPTLEEALNKLPQIVPDFDRTANNPGDGTARVNLRGLGSGRTLVLLNGRRLAPSGVGTAVDLNNLPQALLKRVEIITGGASTVYGSDAVAGVVNFIVRDDLDGFGVDLTAATTEEGDASVTDVNVSFGHNFEAGNITLYGGYYDRHDLFAGARRFTAVPIHDGDGMLTEAGSLATPAAVVTFPPVDFGGGPAMTTFDNNGTPIEFMDPADRYNFAPLNYLQTPLSRKSAGLLFNLDVGDIDQFYGEFSFTNNESRQNLAPVPASNLFFTNLNNPLLSPATQQFFAANFAPPFFPPGTAGFFLSRRLEELGPRIFDRSRDYTRLVAGMRGEFDSGWDYDVWLTYTENDEETLLKNGASAANFQQGLFVDPASGACFDPSGGCVPLNIWGAGNLSPAGVEFIRLPDLLNTTSREQQLLSGYVRGEWFDSWGGPIEVAIGAEWRRDTGRFVADDALFGGDALGYRGSSGIDGEESVYEIYAEASIPLATNAAYAEYLGLELGVRYSNYDNAGSANTYKIGGEWQPNATLSLRTMFQHSVRAPNLAEAFQEQFTETGSFVGNDPINDPCSASADPVGNGITDACVASGIPTSAIGTYEATAGVPTDFVFGGNPDLRPESADTYTVGMVAGFGKEYDWRVSVDYFDLRIEDTIGNLVAAVVCYDSANTQNLFCDGVTRDPNNFNITALSGIKVNRGEVRSSGIDTQIELQSELPNAFAISGEDASVNAKVIWTHTIRTDIQAVSFGTKLGCAGRFGSPCNEAADGFTYPQDRVTTHLNYRSGDLGLFMNWRWIAGTKNAGFLVADFFGRPVPDLVITDIGSSSYFDLGAEYRFSEHIRTRLNVSNLLDNEPPLLADAVVSNNTDTRLYDVFGRSFTLTMTLRY